MTSTKKTAPINALRGESRQHENLSTHTSWRVSGDVAKSYRPADLEDLSVYLKTLPPSEPLLWLGLGSNLLVRSQGFQGTAIFTQGCLKALAPITEAQHEKLNTLALTRDWQSAAAVIRAEAGVSCAQMARYTARQDLGGGEFLAGIPGTVGGALRMNAGCFHGETWDLVIAVETIDRAGTVRLRPASDFTISYRHTELPNDDEWFVAGYFALNAGDKATSLATIRKLLDRRADTQPTGDYSCGSVFRNPPEDYAARLIEACGLKGFQKGGAAVSSKHANFIINQGEASPDDIESLIQYVADTVEKTHGVRLLREVHIVGGEAHS